MGFLGNFAYNLFMFPLEKAVLHRFRMKSVSGASGKVLEIGVGTGVNSRYLNTDKIESLTVLDTSIKKSVMHSMGRRFRNFKYIEGDVENLPFDGNSFDTVVFTLVFCSVGSPDNGLAEVRRVLKDDGNLIFIEHVRPENMRMKKIADNVNPYWNSFSNGCNINRETLSAITEAGFNIQENSYKKKGVFITGTAQKS